MDTLSPITGAEVENVLRLTLYNRDTYRGEYDSGEDWEICSWGNNIDEAIENIISSYFNSGINPDSHYIEVVTRIKWNKDYWYNDEHAHAWENSNKKEPSMSYHDIVKRIKDHPKYAELVEEDRLHKEECERERKEESDRLTKISTEAANKQKKKDELSTLKKLKEKYPNA